MALKNWNLSSVTPNTVTNLGTPGANKEIATVSTIITNYDATSSATVEVTLTDSANAVKGYVVAPTVIATNDTLYIDSKVFIASSATPDKLRVKSSIANTSFITSLDES